MTREEQIAVNAIWKFLEAQEKHRRELREFDDEWKCEVRCDLKELKAGVANMPLIVDEKIAACRTGREGITAHAVELAGEDTAVSGWMSRRIGRIAVVVAIANGLVAMLVVLANWVIN